MNLKYYDLYYTVLNNRDGKEIEDLDNINDYLYDDIGIANLSPGDDVILRWRKIGSHMTYFNLFVLYKWRRNGK